MAKSAPAQPRSPWTFPFCPGPPNWELDWAAILAEFPRMRPMADCRQDPAWHIEGDVLAHTRLVCEAVVAIMLNAVLAAEAPLATSSAAT